jgi:glycosyltransferase involved in cell wall biosynthesis
MASVLIVEEYVPEYRRRFFELLQAALAAQSIRLGVTIGSAATPHDARADAASDLPFVRTVPSHSISLAGRRLTLRRVRDATLEADLVVVDQALRHVENYDLLLRGKHRKVALWGHGARFVKPGNRLERLVEARLLRAAHWFFAYTQRGADAVVARGFPRQHVTVVQNTLDVESLARLRDAVTADDERRLRDELALPDRHVCLFLGALDRSKRLDFLLAAAAGVAERLEDFVLVVAGDGPERAAIETAASTVPWLRYVGRAVGVEKARLGAVADALLMPGAVGLVAVDSFALRTPILTTRWQQHGPEAEYLEDGVNARFSEDDRAEFAALVLHVLGADDELARLEAGCAAARQRYSLDTMVANFAQGIQAALEAPPR